MAKQLSEIHSAALARLFSARVVQELARRGRSPLLQRLVREAGLADLISSSEPIGRIFDIAFRELKRKENRHEYIYKSALTHKVLLGKHSIHSAVLLTEFRAAGRKADAVIINGTSTAYEVKSERDGLERLDSQLRAYRTVFAGVNVITGENHLEGVLREAPRDIGVLLLNTRGQISTIRECIHDTSNIDPLRLFDSLRLSEARQVLMSAGKTIRDVPNTREYALLREMFSRLPPDEAHSYTISVLRITRSLTPLSELVGMVPRSLSAAVLSTKLRKKDYGTLVSALRLPIAEALS